MHRPPPSTLPRARQNLMGYLMFPQILPFGLMLVVIGSLIWGINENARQTQLVNRAQDRLIVIDQIMRNILDAETGLRGYELTHEQEFLRPYEGSQQQLDRNLSILENNPATVLQYQNIHQIRYLMEQWNTIIARPLLENTIHNKQTLLSLNQQDKVIIDQARQVISAVEQNEMVRRREALTRSSQALMLMRLLSVSGLLLAALLMWLSAVRSARSLSQVLSVLNKDVADIAQGQYDLQVSRIPITEVQRLSEQFQAMGQAVKEREARLRRTNANLERSNRELEHFAYIASHDLQEPLRTIGSYTELLARRYKGQLDERADKYIEFTLSATYRLKQLIQDLLAYSRVRQPGRKRSEVETQPLVQGVLDDLSTALQEAHATLDIGPLPTVQGNPELLRHLFQNLISNAIKFRDPARPLVLSIHAQETPLEWAFLVQDNGVGIAPQYFERIFGVFQRLDTHHPGSGIGLAVVRTAAEWHGGAVEVSSQEGVGTTFTLHLPHNPEDDPDKPQVAAPLSTGTYIPSDVGSG